LEEQDFGLQSIERYQVLMPTPDSVIRPLVDRMLVAHGIGPLRDEVETVSDAFGRAYVRQSDAIWIISQGVVEDDVARGQLALLPVDTGETLGPVGFTTRAEAVHSLATAGLMQAVREVAGRERAKG
jgi:LysR family pca operon transcriptional activator